MRLALANLHKVEYCTTSKEAQYMPLFASSFFHQTNTLSLIQSAFHSWIDVDLKHPEFLDWFPKYYKLLTRRAYLIEDP
jgi:hypothetical protein